MNITCLVLNQDWSPLSTAHTPRALSLVSRGKAEVLQVGVQPIITPSCSLDRPSVIRLMEYIKRPRPQMRLTRQNIQKRDGFQCQYCAKRPAELTLDHVIPESRGGLFSWDNLVSCCRPCNKKKRNRTPEEAHMPLLRKPSEPKVSNYLHVLGISGRPEWEPYLIS